jgi:hypothetical protein
MNPSDYLPLAKESIGLLVSVLLIIGVIAPMLHYWMRSFLQELQEIRKTLSSQESACKKAYDRNAQLIHCIENQDAVTERLIRSIDRMNEKTERIHTALRIAFAGRGNGHTWEEARKHYEIASRILADDVSDGIIEKLHNDTPPSGSTTGDTTISSS